MNSTDYLGRTCVDIITGFKGVCIAYDECLYGCSNVVLQPVSDDPKTIIDPKSFLTTRVRIVDESVFDGVVVPEYISPKFWGSVCKDKVTGFQGVCVERRISLFNADQYTLVASYNKDSLFSHEEYLMIDEGRIIELESSGDKKNYIKNEIENNSEKQNPVTAEEVRSSRSGGMHDYSNREREVKAILSANGKESHRYDFVYE